MTNTGSDVAANNANPPRQSSGNASNSTPLEQKTTEFLMKNFEYSLIFIFTFVVFVMNFIAVSISLQCNQDKSLIVKISSAMFAFMFGFLYILINYFMYRVNLKGTACTICSDNPYPFAT
tara:strand:- start:142 stop:501 length:360 start_codon:yes stop_codon:yes gene_type:complete